MSTDGDNPYHLPGATPRYLLPEQEPAQVRPGPTAPHPDHGGGVPEASTLLESIRQARELFRIARNPASDPLYRHLRPDLLRAEAWLQRQFADDPLDAASAVLLQEVRRYLGRRTA